MTKKISNKVILLFLLALLITNLTTLVCYEKIRKTLYEAQKQIKEYKQMTNQFRKLPLYLALEKDLGNSEKIAYKLTDGKEKYIFTQTIYLSDILNFYNEFPEINDKRVKHLCEAGFFSILNSSGNFIYVSEEKIKELKKNYSSCLISYKDYERMEKLLKKSTLKQILQNYFLETEYKYILTPNLKKFKDFTPNMLFAYLYLNYNIVTSCPEGKCFIDKELNPQIQFYIKCQRNITN